MDYSPAVLQRRKELQEELHQEREKGNKVALRPDKIVRLDQGTNRFPKHKRYLSESPEGAAVTKEFSLISHKENCKQISKKSKSQNITNFLRPSQLNPTAGTSTDKGSHENQKN